MPHRVGLPTLVLAKSTSAEGRTAIEITLVPSRVGLWLGMLIAFLLLAHDIVIAIGAFTGHQRLYGLTPLFNLDDEQNIPTLFSSLLDFGAAALCVLLWRIGAPRGPRDAMWVVLAGALAWVGIDEFCSIHESIVKPLQNEFHFTGLLYFAWVVPYGLAVIALGVTFIPFLWRLPARTRRLMLAASGVYLFGSLFLESLGGTVWEVTPNKFAPTWLLLTTFEETLEMVGMALFIYAALDLLVRIRGAINIELRPSPTGP
jgi:hypothetical protein